ncbi:site-specific DNA-methyltransferase [Thauera propionica]|uniref:site-specific DNA-methyltransferase n=1 Tax=Thauera propionica TaxID=2019431 RepID=UPI0023F369C1|nr:site-specific DNA-methyltransferase [Thauera propionica]MDD3674735.1 site-specific DNA-methyltransferase [Thauera propionica]
MSMQNIDAQSPEARSADLIADNIARLRALFPELVTESGKGVAINVDVLKSLVGDAAVTDADEKYGLNWHGKRRARQIALTPSTGTLRPCPEESVDWEATQNLMIEGDNLEVLKLLQKSYAGKVKLIYIDPPYNTGKDFVYPDSFQDSIRNYLELTGQTEGGAKVSSNTEASGRFHTDWLNMMYPRLKLARTLLSEDGAIFISCDDGEIENLRCVLNEIFGEENFIAQFVWRARQFTDTRANTNVSTDHEYILAYARESDFSLRGIERDESKFSNPDNDPRGPWMSRSILGLATRDQRPNLHYDLVDPLTGRQFLPNPSTGWRYSKERMAQLISEGRILFPVKDDGRPREKKFRSEMQSEFIAFRTIIDGVHTADGTQEIRQIFGAEVFSFPKPTDLIRRIVEQVVKEDEFALDFFAGSGTTGHAVMVQNGVDGGRRRYILVQLPEYLDLKNRDQGVAASYCDELGKPRSLAELTKERLRRAANKLKAANPIFSGDLGFRVFKLDTSNIRAWNPNANDLRTSLFDHLEHIEPGRNADDILYEILLKLGLDLCVPIEQQTIAGKQVHSVGGGVLMACLAEDIKATEAEALALGMAAWREAQGTVGDTTAVFRDNAFQNDVAKSNLAAILEQHGIKQVRSL